jgi:hypothetical protein
MNFTAPAALFWALLAIPIVIFYILKIRLRRVPVSTVMFWEQIFEEKQARSIWQKLRHLLSLLMQLLLLALLVLALADPFFSWEARQKMRLVLVLDNSASMQATDVTPSRLDAAKQEALKVIDRLRPRDEMAIVTAGTQPRVVCGLTRHQRTLRTAVHEVTTTDGPTRVKDAIELGRRLLAEHPQGKIVVVSDGRLPDANELLAAADVSWLPIGTDADNVGITRFQVRRSLLDPLGYQVLLEARNFAESAVDCRLELELAGNVVDVWPLKLDAGATWSKHIEQTSAAGGVLVARLSHADALALDNEARAILPQRNKQPVLLVTEGNRFLQGVFAANPLVELSTSTELPANVPAGTLIVLHKKTPAQLPPGNVVVLQPTESNELWDTSDTLDNPLVAQQDKDSPLMAHVRLDNVLLPEARKLAPKTAAKVLAASETGDPLYLAIEHPRGRVLVLTVNLDRGDLPLRTAFPILFSNALAWFEGSGGELREAVAAGSLPQIALPRELLHTPDGQPTKQLRLESPSGATSEILVRDDHVTIGPLAECGIWTLTPSVGWAAPANPTTVQTEDRRVQPTLQIACNLADPVESDLRAIDVPTSPAEPLTAGFSRPLWFYLTLLAWGLMGTEWWMYQRRKIA